MEGLFAGDNVATAGQDIESNATDGTDRGDGILKNIKSKIKDFHLGSGLDTYACGGAQVAYVLLSIDVSMSSIMSAKSPG